MTSQAPAYTSETLFAEVASQDFLGFSFGGKAYQQQIEAAVASTKALCGVDVELRTYDCNGEALQVVWCTHNFEFLGGSLGCAEGEKVTRAFEFALERNLPVVVVCRTGGARMQEGTMSLMQMAKVSVAIEKHRRHGLAFVSVLVDPTYGGVSASYAMQADVRIAVENARIGFAGPAVILNTMFEMDQSKYDVACPDDFQSARYVQDHGQVDIVASPAENQSVNELIVEQVLKVLRHIARPQPALDGSLSYSDSDFDADTTVDYTLSRKIDRYQAQDIINQIFTDFVELVGDGKVGTDPCIRGGLASFQGRTCMVMGTFKGHTPGDMQKANYGMASPHGYRTALRLMQLAERFNIPVVTLVDTCGAWPSFEAERDGQSEAIATNLTAMAGLKVPIVTIIIGEGGSGGALGIGMGNCVGMLSRAYFGVISPEGAASILGRYNDDAHKARQFPLDCQELATAQQIYAYQLKQIGVVDQIIWENKDAAETYESFPVLKERLVSFIGGSLAQLSAMSPEALVEQRYGRFRALGNFRALTAEERAAALNFSQQAGKKPKRPDTTPSKLIKAIAEEIVNGERSLYKGRAPAGMTIATPVPPTVAPLKTPPVNAKKILDAEGPEALARWLKQQTRVLITDTTMRDAHQSLLATRVRTEDLVAAAAAANTLLADAFSFECWGGATFDVCYRFLHEDPWERLRKIRAAAPDVCLQMLVRGSNAVGYTSYPDNVIEEFVHVAARNGIDVFRIFDCFNDVEQMKVCINAVRAAGKVAEVCVCYTSDVMKSDIYTLDYYKSVVRAAVDAGAHIIGIKDMAGLLKPMAAHPLMQAVREVTDLPVHFHTHSTSSAALTTAIMMAQAGCEIVDLATASMADGTSQPSLNAFLAAMAGAERDPGIDYLALEPLDSYWARVRDMYSPFESGMKSGTARVYDHEIPGGQYSNLLVQCNSLGLRERWEEVLDSYRDVNKLLGDVVKVTPSSKCVGDLALYLVNRGLKASDIVDPEKAANIDFPQSVVELLEGRLGFPHRGFPEAVTRAVLKGKSPLTTRPSAALAPANFEQVQADLSAEFGRQMTMEDVVGFLLYPKVFRDYMRTMNEKSWCITHLPSPVVMYGMRVGDAFTCHIPSEKIGDVIPGATAAEADNGSTIPVTIRLKRVGPVAAKTRAVYFDVNGAEQIAKIRDASSGEVFDGPMADASNPLDIGSPMPGLVEKVEVKAGSIVKAGQVLATVSAMKMEVQVKCPMDAMVEEMIVEPGSKVVEGALLMKLRA